MPERLYEVHMSASWSGLILAESRAEAERKASGLEPPRVSVDSVNEADPCDPWVAKQEVYSEEKGDWLSVADWWKGLDPEEMSEAQRAATYRRDLEALGQQRLPIGGAL
jgi:hypothetical protein